MGTYHLIPPTDRSGSIDIFRTTAVSPSSFDPSRSPFSLTYLSTYPSPHGAILDLQFSPESPQLIAAACSLGSIAIYRLLPTFPIPELTLVRTLNVAAEGVLVLSVTWGSDGLLGYTLSSGAVGVVDGSGDGEKRRILHAHSLEAWTCVFSVDGRMVFSGGDDGAMVGWDLVADQEVVRTGRREHGAGVTAVLPRIGGCVLITGSYDETLRVLDLRAATGKATVMDELGLEGGVWRLKEVGVGEGRLVASCMHAGARVVDTSLAGDGGRGATVVRKWVDNESMNYGCDVHPENPSTVASCSFYDKRVCVWTI